MNPMGEDFEQMKRKTITDFTKVLLDAIQNEEITQERSKEIASALLLGFKAVRDKDSLYKFMVEWGKNWKIFEPLVKMQTISTSHTEEDKQKLDAIKKQLADLGKIS